MDLNTLMKLMTSDNTVNALGSNSGTDSDAAMAVMSSLLPQLISGASQQATNKKTAAGFQKALNDHSTANTRDIAAFIKSADLDDGEKIIQHLLGGETNTAVKTAAKNAGISGKDAMKIAALAAPLLMGVLGQQSKKQQQAKSAADGSALIQALMGGGTGTQASSGISAADAISLLSKFMK